MISFAEIVIVHLRHNGDIYLAHWYVWLMVIMFALSLFGTLAGTLAGALRR